jgi:hypothetical protein
LTEVKQAEATPRNNTLLSKAGSKMISQADLINDGKQFL